MYYQPSIFGELAAQKGIETAVAHAEAEQPGWAQLTYDLFIKEFLPAHKRFMAEDFRAWLAVNKPDYEFPPHKRAFGGIVREAAKNGFIKKDGYQAVSNVKAHRCFASIWVVASTIQEAKNIYHKLTD